MCKSPGKQGPSSAWQTNADMSLPTVLFLARVIYGMSAWRMLHAFHNIYHKDAFTKSCLCRLSSGRCRIRACAAPGLILLEQGLRLFSDHVASCCSNVRPEMHDDIIDPAHPIIVWVFGISYL